MVNGERHIAPTAGCWLRREILSINQQHFAHRDDLETRRQYCPPDDTRISGNIRVKLPATLVLVCYHTPELCELASMLQTRLRKHGCELTISRKDREEWHTHNALTQADLLLGDYLAGGLPGFALAEWFTDEPAWATALGEDIWQKEKQKLMGYCGSEESLSNLLPSFFNLCSKAAHVRRCSTIAIASTRWKMCRTLC